MKSSNPRQTIIDLLSDSPESTNQSSRSVLKMCGFTRTEDVNVALQNGANLIGMIFVPSTPRVISDSGAKEIIATIWKYGERTSRIQKFEEDLTQLKNDKLSPKLWYRRCIDLLQKVTLRRPLSVGVFQDQLIDYVSEFLEKLGAI